MKSVVIIGASGHGKVVADIIRKSGDRVVGFLDDNLEKRTEFDGGLILGTVKDYVEYSLEAEFIIAIGNAAIRESIAIRLGNVKWYTAIHPTAIISDTDFVIGNGTVVMANAVVNPGSCIGEHCIINTGAVVEHDNRIKDYAHISVGAKLAGTVYIGKRTWIGIGAVVKNNVNICSDCIIGAGAVVVKDIEEAGTYIGIPAKMIKI